jgi:hypothetical protein
MLLFETQALDPVPQARDPVFTYNICPNGTAGDWYWEVTCGGDIVARGLAATREQARAEAVISARAHPTPAEPSRALAWE